MFGTLIALYVSRYAEAGWVEKSEKRLKFASEPDDTRAEGGETMLGRVKKQKKLGLERLEERMVLTSNLLPTPDAQYMLELVNFARTRPADATQQIMTKLDSDEQATLKFYGVDAQAERNAVASIPSKAPLAWDTRLASAAQDHSQDMASKNFQSHDGSDGSNLDTRLDRAGYVNRVSSAENAFAYAKSVRNAMQAFLYDWGVSGKWHRKTLLEPETAPEKQYTEIGIGIVDKPGPGATGGMKVITQNLGRRTDSKAQILGVVYEDRDNDRFYTPGEGTGDASIEITNRDSGTKIQTRTWGSGGYQTEVGPGNYRVTLRVPGRSVQTQDVTVSNQNVKVDFVLGLDRSKAEPIAATPTPAPAPMPAPAPAPVVKPTTVVIPTRTVTSTAVNVVSRDVAPAAAPPRVEVAVEATAKPAAAQNAVNATPTTREDDLAALKARTEAAVRAELARIQGDTQVKAQAEAAVQAQADASARALADQEARGLSRNEAKGRLQMPFASKLVRVGTADPSNGDDKLSNDTTWNLWKAVNTSPAR